MGRHDWFRNTSWDDAIEAAFLQKLKRAREKAQYLRIQASTLASSHPDVALRLLDQYFELGDDFAHAQAHMDRAVAYRALGQINRVIEALEAALAREKVFPNQQTRARVELAMLIVIERKSELYARASELMKEGAPFLIFPRDVYEWNGAHALLLHELGQHRDGQQLARLALEAAEKTKSGFRHHPNVGLVTNTEDEFGRRVRRISGGLH